MNTLEKKNIDWANLGFGYMKTDYRFVANFKDGKWDEGTITTDENITMNECACVFQKTDLLTRLLKQLKRILITFLHTVPEHLYT